MAKSKKKQSNSSGPLLIAVVAIIAVAALMLSKCGGDDAESKFADSDYSDVAIVLGSHQNSPVPKVSDELISEIKNVVLANKLESINIVNATKTPDVQPIEIMDQKKWGGSNPDAIRKSVDDAIDQGTGSINLTPKTDHADYIEAIKTASNYMSSSSSDNKKPKLIVVIGSGLSDTGVLDFANGNLLNKTSDEIIDKIGSKLEGSETEFSNVAIRWLNLGETFAPQIPLSPDYKKKEEEIYRSVLEKMGFKKNNLSFTSKAENGKQVDNDGKIVKPVDIADDEISWDDFKMSFDDTSLGGFITNSADFNDINKAKEAISGLASLLRGNTIKINIEGSQMKEPGQPAVSHGEIAQMRADAVKKLLVDMGIDANRISTSNVGSSQAKTDQVPADKKVTITAVK